MGVLVHLRLQHADGDIIGNQLPLIHVALGQLSEFRFPFDVGTENVPCTQVDKLVVLNKEGALGAFPAPGGPNKIKLRIALFLSWILS